MQTLSRNQTHLGIIAPPREYMMQPLVTKNIAKRHIITKLIYYCEGNKDYIKKNLN